MSDTPDEPDTDETRPEETRAEETGGATKPPRQVSVPLSTLVRGGVIAVLVALVGVLGVLYWGARSELAARDRQTHDDERAQQVALDYAVGAARMDFRDLSDWQRELVAGTSAELRTKLTEAAESMEQILTPLQWESSAKPLAAVVRSHNDDIYVVDAFVSVFTKTTQAPDGLQSTATYSVTLDRGSDWQITDVGGIDAVLGTR
ncbi:hypothetical protein H7J77_13385 [Mycolicibacillus parakoreensis]|uniref:Mce-associated membrane protein n=1 Tax=Mycolicibacillus parakoreensis TaxID=1069221 RepID=A0ABY3U4S7_9MYCO|nr:hypothetical protein [Mycolicibacillus parakoreensis]MCV7316531.1 hypothetical protein [Mycolicibacillus parakoreensis]ULN52756.1 hypothetical protein MIU77_18370 [Mycolicibacillus parakoreensis]HLR98354.1 hypothetical protein [Mycolicibacillus parakoreensis]